MHYGVYICKTQRIYKVLNKLCGMIDANNLFLSRRVFYLRDEKNDQMMLSFCEANASDVLCMVITTASRHKLEILFCVFAFVTATDMNNANEWIHLELVCYFADNTFLLPTSVCKQNT